MAEHACQRRRHRVVWLALDATHLFANAGDHGYRHGTEYAALSPTESIANADSYLGLGYSE